MKTGRSLVELAQELERQAESKKDYVVSQGVIEPRVLDGEVVLDGINGQPLKIRNHAHKQFADHLGIPAKYYDRMKIEKPELLAQNLATWLTDSGNEKRMLRVLDGALRGFLSAKYRPLDNFDLAQAIIPTLIEKKVKILSTELTETRFYIKGILPELSDELPEGLVWGSGHTNIERVAPTLLIPTDQQVAVRGRGRLVSAITISNSEVGNGALSILPSVFTAWCTNMAALVQAAMRKYHVGRGFDADENNEIFRDETRRVTDAAFWMKVKDVTNAAFDEKAFRVAIESIREAGGKQIVSADLAKVVDVTVRQLALPTSTAPSILNFLARGGDLSQWGLSSSITAVANDVSDYEVATQLEKAGGEVLALKPVDWERIANAA